MTVKVRFAPSPTGYLHIGNARAALINWLFAKKNHGTFLLRIDDTDLERSKKEYEDAILKDMEWLGLTHHEFARESERFDRYDTVKQQMIQSGRLYPCYETQEELEFKRKRQLGRGEPPRYDRASLHLTEAEKKTYEAEGRKPHYRFFLESKDVAWTDMIRGHVHFGPDNLSDPVLVREDGAYLYTFTSVIDDIDFEITHIIRGEDHVTNTAVQIQIFEALGRDSKTMTFGHSSLLMDKDGTALSKRLGSLSLGQMREQGIEPMAINSLLARLGTSLPVEPFLRLNDLAESFDVGTFSRNPPRFDLEELHALNHKLWCMMPFHQVKERLDTKGFTRIKEEEWELFKGNIHSLDDIGVWENVFHGDVLANHETEKDYLKEAFHHFPKDEITVETWGMWTSLLKEKTGRKGKDLFMPLRKALTGMDHGPEMKFVLPILGRELIEKRLLLR
jgi:glutamyl-tRNA synthetase